MIGIELDMTCSVNLQAEYIQMKFTENLRFLGHANNNG